MQSHNLLKEIKICNRQIASLFRLPTMTLYFSKKPAIITTVNVWKMYKCKLREREKSDIKYLMVWFDVTEIIAFTW